MVGFCDEEYMGLSSGDEPMTLGGSLYVVEPTTWKGIRGKMSFLSFASLLL